MEFIEGKSSFVPSEAVAHVVPSPLCAHITRWPGSSSEETDSFHVARKRPFKKDSMGDIA